MSLLIFSYISRSKWEILSKAKLSSSDVSRMIHGNLFKPGQALCPTHLYYSDKL